jgi:hypothetical protein
MFEAHFGIPCAVLNTLLPGWTAEALYRARPRSQGALLTDRNSRL